MSLNPGDLLRERYRINGIIGKGGMGAVYRGEDTALQTTVAIKENLNPLPQAVKQFKREAVLLASLRHPNLPRVTDHFTEGDLQYLIMDYVPGDDLKTILERQGALPESQVVGWCREICDALTYLHTQHPPVTHRDIKPANIKITPDGKPVLVDFGIAKASEAGAVTTTGARSLTPGFAPPEQYGSSPTDSRSDQYSLAATVYNLLTGHIPPDSLDRALEQTALKPVREWNPKISPAVDASIWKAMSLSPSERFLTVKDFYDALSGDTELEISAPAVTLPSGKEPLTVIRRTPEKTTREKAPPPEAAAQPLSGRPRIPVSILAAVGALLCLTATGIAVGGYAVSGGWPLAAKPSPSAENHQTAAVSASPTATRRATDGKTTPKPSLPVPTVTLSPTPESTPIGGSPLLAFVSDRDGGKRQIFTYNLVTNKINQLTSDSAKKGRVAWSPDGRKIYYESLMTNGKMDIFVMDADGSNPFNLTNNESDDTYPAPSPVSDRIALVSDRNGWKLIYWMQINGSNPFNVSALHKEKPFNMPREWDPAWSPDGLTLYLVLYSTSGPARVYRWNTQNPSASPSIVNMMDGDYQEAEPDISPSGQYLAYTKKVEGGSYICISLVTDHKPCTSPLTDIKNNADADWSADNQWLAYTKNYGGNSDIYLIMISGAGETNLTKNPANDMYPALQPLPAIP
jgi:serine/threonine protein kinase